VVGIIRAALPIEGSLEHPDPPVLADHRCTELNEKDAVVPHTGGGRGSKIHPDVTAADAMGGLAVRRAATDELSVQLRCAPNSPADDPHVLHGPGERVRDHRILRVNPGGERQPVPLDMIAPPPDAGFVRFAFEGVELSTSLEPDAPSLAQQEALGSQIRPGAEFLHLGGLQVRTHPFGAPERRDGEVLERVIAEPESGTHAAERTGAAAALRLRLRRKGSGGGPARIVADALGAVGGFLQAGVVEVPADFKAGGGRP
jgi:hypothetical protein